MYLEFFGAADGVTGSMHRLHVGDRDVLLDCGLFQGRRSDANRLNRETPKWASQAHCLVLSHAHIDHSGRIPVLVKNGFVGNVYATPPTRDLCSVMLRDSAMIQGQDAAYLNKKLARSGSKERIEPLYDVADAQAAVQQMISIPLHRPMTIAPGVTLTFHNSGHVLGSALVQLDLEERGRKARLLFTGDLGRAELPLLKSPEIVDGVDYLLTESTYGDRSHAHFDEVDAELATIVSETIARGGRVYIPTFALERAQEVLFSFWRDHAKDSIPDVPIYIDSPLAIAITEIYKLHPESLDEEVQRLILARNDPFSPPGLEYISQIDDSKALQARTDPCIIIAGSGMCEGGRIVHHFAKALGNVKNTVIIVGYQADHTLGRRLVEGHKKVKVMGVPREVYCRVHTLNGLSAHGDKEDLLEFAKRTAAVGQVKRVILVHGEEESRAVLENTMVEHGLKVHQSKKGERLEL